MVKARIVMRIHNSVYHPCSGEPHATTPGLDYLRGRRLALVLELRVNLLHIVVAILFHLVVVAIC